ncbi:glycosyltransferase family 2 protein [Georgenia satyanarayanai]|uniref:glycosyltransferase family 2 protein n=1 Tax=Georgenia satyanarayanai TaxID=860221 RepID=UPI00203A83E5|nr:glycosyltransferase family 2 protein [Georgenia satyanarayanai]MCM3661043.1 glycosyltransferase family 2 protein [Georgenia satyanarayanai]
MSRNGTGSPAPAGEGAPPANGVTAVVVTYEPDPGVTLPLLTALAQQCERVIVVDNGSAASLRERLREACARLGAELVELPTNRGIAAAQNAGIARARRGRYVLLMDQDSMPAPDMVSLLVAGARDAAAQGLAVGAVGPVSADTRSTTEEMVYVSRTWGPRRARAAQLRAERVETAFLLASGCLVPVPVLDRVGEMNEAWFIDHVDLEWGLRARRAGYGLYAIPGALLAHTLGDRLTKLPGRAQEVHVHSPVRTYYLTRNTVHLVRSGLLGWRWALGYVVWLGKYVAFNALLAAPRGERVRRMAQGLRDGLLGRTGPAPR